MILITDVTASDTVNIFLTLCLSFTASASATNFAIATGRPICVNVIAKMNVGTAII
ncbi:Uncharacterised protein [Streptococcus pneumoniae]|nr:Uncharacterised protein [Streptococcus pneumoniae]CKE90222.1 Uncharacterised protein [Streptococcus pneumoniae]COF86075.1 Uncharacterised protein [Streptococcus pneumoniae]